MGSSTEQSMFKDPAPSHDSGADDPYFELPMNEPRIINSDASSSADTCSMLRALTTLAQVVGRSHVTGC